MSAARIPSNLPCSLPVPYGHRKKSVCFDLLFRIATVFLLSIEYITSTFLSPSFPVKNSYLGPPPKRTGRLLQAPKLALSSLSLPIENPGPARSRYPIPIPALFPEKRSRHSCHFPPPTDRFPIREWCLQSYT